MIVKVLDILHSDNGKGKYRESKVGEKYENRKNKYYTVDFDDLMPWGGLEMLEVSKGTITGGEKDIDVYMPIGGGIWTTEYERHKEVDGKLEIYTWNSIYVCEVIDEHN
jgi:hypothetical protein